MAKFLCSAPGVVESNRDDLLEQLIVWDSAVLGRVCEILFVGNLRIGVGLEQIELAIFRHPIVEPRISTQKHVAIDSF